MMGFNDKEWYQVGTCVTCGSPIFSIKDWKGDEDNPPPVKFHCGCRLISSQHGMIIMARDGEETLSFYLYASPEHGEDAVTVIVMRKDGSKTVGRTRYIIRHGEGEVTVADDLRPPLDG